MTIAVTGLILYSSSSFQTFVAKKGAAWLSGRLHTKITLDKIHIRDLHYLEIDNLFVEDLAKDTLLYTKRLTVDLLSYKKLDVDKNSLEVDYVDLDEGRMFIHKDAHGRSNLDFFINFFSGSKDTTTSSKPFTLRIRDVAVHDFHFKLENEVNEKVLPKGIFNINDLDLNHLNLKANNLFEQDDSVTAIVTKLSVDEKSGFRLNNLSTRLRIGPHQMTFDKLRIITPQSDVGDHFEMHFKKFDDLDRFEDEVYMKVRLTHTHLASRDIAYFSSDLAKMNLKATISCLARGKLNNLKIKDFDLQTASNTRIKGNFAFKGLPDIPATFMYFDFKDLQTSRRDAETLLREAGYPKSIEDLPIELTRAGALRYRGHFQGFYNDFVANGVLNTSLGDVASDINVKFLPHQVPSYSGMLSATNFHLGKLLGTRDLAGLTFSAEVKGSGFKQKELTMTLDTHIAYVDFQGYRYSDINFRGTRMANFFSGYLSINDPNLKLGFDGDVNLNAATPEYKFIADIKYADLRALHFLKDSLVLKTKLDIDAKGNSFNTIEGKFKTGLITVVRNGIAHTVDSLSLYATKKGDQRSLVLSSCMLDANLSGNYNLANFPSAIKRVLIRYIPSGPWGTIVPVKAQNFDFHMEIHDAEPLLTAFLPGYQMPGPSVIQGRFNGKTGVFKTSGKIHEIDAGNLEFNNVSFEGENEERQNIDLSVSADSIRLNGKILAQNLNISNSIKNDSLNFNVKVSDVDAVNHLDLNGQIGFGDKVAGLSFLPSELVLDKKPWEIENNFRVLFKKDNIAVQGFAIRHDGESLTIGGLVSSREEDTITANFHKFDIAAANQILREYNLQLNGRLNGKATFSSVLGSPSLESSLGIDSLAINKVYVGLLDLTSNYDGTDKTISFDGDIHRKLIDVVKLEGNIGLSESNNSINASLKMNNAEAVILQPLVGDLVSNLKGRLSADLTVTGNRTDPVIDGNIKFNNTEFTVNYLKTRYHINDEVDFEQGLINIRNLTLLDNYYSERRPSLHRAQLTGQIDLSHLSRPYFNVDVHANDFSCLNTNEKDNEEYYGSAIATGDFSFDGPLETMNIDITATTNKGTTFNIPLNRPSTAGRHDYIAFVTHRDSVDIARRTKNLHTGVTLNFDLNITPDATAKIIFDKSIGDVISGAGNSDMNLKITPQGDFLMFGTFEIEHGDYLFTSQNVLNKLFTVERGGTVQFTGDPATAQVNLHANYQARTSIANLYDAANVQRTNAAALDQSVLVGCRINLEGDLNRPSFDFDLVFPNDPNIEYDLQTYLSSNEVVTNQSMLFLVSNQFNGKLTPSNGVAIATSTGVQFVSSQLSNLLTNFSSNVDLNFRSLSDVGFNYRMLGDRMLVTGNIASTDLSSNIGYNPLALVNTNLTGNIELDYLLNRQRNLTARVFDKPVPLDILKGVTSTSTLYSPGVGLVYQKDFSSIGGLFRKKRKIPLLIPPNWREIIKARAAGSAGAASLPGVSGAKQASNHAN